MAKTRNRVAEEGATELIKKAVSLGLTYKKIGEICNTHQNSVCRWYTSGKADMEKIRPLKEKLQKMSGEEMFQIQISGTISISKRDIERIFQEEKSCQSSE